MSLLAAVHDVAPATAQEVIRLRRLLHDCNVRQIALLVVPDWHGRQPLEDHPELVARLQRLAAAGDEILLHGLTHREDPPRRPGSPLLRAQAALRTAGEGEFLRLDRAEAARRIDEGWQRLQALGLPPRGFVAPAWLYSAGTRAALRDRQLLHEDALHLFFPDGRRIVSPVLGLAARTPARLAVSALYCEALSLILKRSALVRVALHPVDASHPAALRVLERTLRRLGRTHRATSYRAVADRLRQA